MVLNLIENNVMLYDCLKAQLNQILSFKIGQRDSPHVSFYENQRWVTKQFYFHIFINTFQKIISAMQAHCTVFTSP